MTTSLMIIQSKAPLSVISHPHDFKASPTEIPAIRYTAFTSPGMDLVLISIAFTASRISLCIETGSESEIDLLSLHSSGSSVITTPYTESPTRSESQVERNFQFDLQVSIGDSAYQESLVQLLSRLCPFSQPCVRVESQPRQEGTGSGSHQSASRFRRKKGPPDRD